MMILTLASCNKDDVAQAEFQVKQVTSATQSSQASTFTFSKALFGISEIDFEIETGTEDQEYEYDGPFQFNVLTETSSPTINAIEIAPGSYHELEFQIDEVLSSGNSIEISGIYDDIIRINSDSNSNLVSIIENNLDDAMDFDDD